MNTIDKINIFLTEEKNITNKKDPRQIASDYIKHFKGNYTKAYNALHRKVKEVDDNSAEFMMWVNAREFVKHSMPSTKDKIKKEKIKRDLIDYEDDRKYRVQDTINAIKKHQGR